MAAVPTHRALHPDRTAVVGLVLGLLIFRLNGLYLAMATVAFDLIISVIAINGGELTGGSTGRYGVHHRLHDGPSCSPSRRGRWSWSRVSELGRTGRRVDAVRDDPELAASVGIRVRRYRLVAFVVSGALGGCAGAINILVRSAVSPLDIGFGLIVLALTMIIVGGALSWKGAVIGAVIFTWLPDFLSVVGEWQELIYGIIVARRGGLPAARDLRPLRRPHAGRAPCAPAASPARGRGARRRGGARLPTTRPRARR